MLRFALLIVVLCATLPLAACGGATSTAADEQARVVGGSHGVPRLTIPPGPAPKELVIKDLKKGTGKPIKHMSDEIAVDYVGVNYRTGKVEYNTFNWAGPVRYILSGTHRGWQIGLMGMREGGERELIDPPRLTYGPGTDPLIYVVYLRKVTYR